MVVATSLKVMWTPITSEGTALTEEKLQNINKLSISFNIGKTADSFSLTLADKKDGVEDYYFYNMKEGDLLKLYYVAPGAADVLLLDATVSSTKKMRTVDSKRLVVSGLNRLESLLGLITVLHGKSGTSKSADAWIRLILREVNTQNGYAEYTNDEEPVLKGAIKDVNKYIYGGTLTEWRAAGNDETSLTWGNTFQKGDEVAFELIERLSNAKYAVSNHIFYLDNTNHFRWVSVSTTASTAFNTSFATQQITHQNYNTYNYVIVKAGTNLYGNANVNIFNYDLLNAVKNGIKATVEYQEGISSLATSQLRTAEVNQALFSEDDFPFPSAYPINLPADWSGSTSSAASASALNAAFVEEVAARAKDYSDDFLAGHSKASYKGKETLLKTADFVTDNQLADFKELPFISGQSDGVRITSKTLTFSPKKGWSCDVSLEEDIDKVF